MKNLFCFAALTLTALTAPAAHAGFTFQQLFSWTNDRDSNVDTFNLMLDEKGAPAGFQTRPNGHEGREENFLLKDVQKPDGVTILEGQGHKVIILQGQLSRSTPEGRFHMKYLANGLSNTYETCDFLLKSDGTNWFVQNAYTGKKVTAMKIITWSLGLKTLQGICK